MDLRRTDCPGDYLHGLVTGAITSDVLSVPPAAHQHAVQPNSISSEGASALWHHYRTDEGIYNERSITKDSSTWRSATCSGPLSLLNAHLFSTGSGRGWVFDRVDKDATVRRLDPEKSRTTRPKDSSG